MRFLGAWVAAILACGWGNHCLGGLAEGDVAFQKRAEGQKAREALAHYRQVHEADPRDAEAGWRVGMASQFVGLRLETDNDEKAARFREGRDAARAAAQLRPDCAACEFWTAINMALYGETVGVLKTLSTLTEVKRRLKRAAELDPAYAHGGADRVLGLVYQKVPGLLGGDDDRAKAHFEKAIQAAPGNPLNYLCLTLLLADEMQNPAAAIATAERGLSFPEPGTHEIESRDAWRELYDWYAKAKGVTVGAR